MQSSNMTASCPGQASCGLNNLVGQRGGSRFILPTAVEKKKSMSESRQYVAARGTQDSSCAAG